MSLEGLALALVGIVALLVLSERTLALAFGVLLPLDYIQSVDPFLLDGARYALAFAIAVKAWGSPTRMRHAVLARTVLALLLLLGAFLMVSGTITGVASVARVGLTGVLSVGAAFLLAVHIDLHRTLVVGFVLGCMISSGDIIAQAVGGPFLGLATQYGVRYSGFSFKSTAVAPLIAIAIVAVVTPWLWQGKARALRAPFAIRCAMASVLAVALFLSGGRGGMVALAFAICVGAAFEAARHPWRAVGVTVVAFVGAIVFREELYQAIVRPDTADLSNGRGELNATAWAEFLASPLFGVSPETLPLLRPHTPLITFAVEAGVLGLVIAAVLFAIHTRIALGASPGANFPISMRMMASVMVVVALVEPDGFFVGLSKVLVLMLVVVQFDHARQSESTPGEGRAVDPVVVDRLGLPPDGPLVACHISS